MTVRYCALIFGPLLLLVAACSTSATIHTYPPGAKVFLRGQFVGRSPVNVSLTDGTATNAVYYAKLVKKGYRTSQVKLAPTWSPGFLILDTVLCIPTLGLGCYLYLVNGKTHPWNYHFTLEPGLDPAPRAKRRRPRRRRSTAPSPLPPVGDVRPTGPAVAVFPLHDASGKLAADVRDQLSEYATTKLAEVTGLRVISSDRLRKRVSKVTRDSGQPCVAEPCHLAVARAMRAAKVIAPKLLRIGGQCVLSANIVDRATATTERAASAPTDCSAKGLMEGIDRVAADLRAKGR